MHNKEYDQQYYREHKEYYKNYISSWYKSEKGKMYSKKKYEDLSLEERMIVSAKSRNSKKKLDFDILSTDIIIPEFCCILGLRLQSNMGVGKATRRSPSLDRIDNNKGHTKGNIQVISKQANAMKSDASVEELQRFAQWVLKTYPL